MHEIQCNVTHRFAETLSPMFQAEIEACPRMDGVSYRDLITRADVPNIVKSAVRELDEMRAHKRKHWWLYIRPQYCELGAADKRSGAFWHMDVDAIYRSVAPDWDDFLAMAVSFGDVGETEFISTPMMMPIDGPPRSSDYVKYSALVTARPFDTHSPKPCQVAHYMTPDFHRAGPIRRTGWRLIILAFETDAEPKATWP